jgi:chemotaxis protein CheD
MRKIETKDNDVLPGFSHINRYWDRTNKKVAAKILPGEYYVTQKDELIVTVLGSCISACIRDEKRGIGGMNHFMLPEQNGGSPGSWDSSKFGAATRYGNYAMEHMINDILKYGGKREDLEVKICGGGMILKNMTDIGKKNIQFVKEYLQMEGYRLASEDVGDKYPRKVQYTPALGRLRVKKLRSMHNDTILKREDKYRHEIVDKPVEGEIELF